MQYKYIRVIYGTYLSGNINTKTKVETFLNNKSINLFINNYIKFLVN